MSGTFHCPHCQASYPRKPVLVGRVVRCTTCKNAFRLREDGIADPVEIAAPPAAPTTTPGTDEHVPHTDSHHAEEPSAVEPPPRMIAAPAPVDDLELTPARGQLAVAPSPASAPRPATSIAGRSVKLTAQQIQAQRAMAATLTTSITAALQSESVAKEEVPGAVGPAGSRRLPKAGGKATKALPSQDGAVGNLGPAVLTGSGDEESRTNRTWMIGCLGILVATVVGGWLLLQRSDEVKALDDFILVHPDRVREYGDRLSALQANAWFVALPPNGLGVTPFQDLGQTRLGKPRPFDLKALRTAIDGSIKGLIPLADGGGWTTPDPEPGPEASKPTTRRVVTRKDFDAALSKAGLAEAEDREAAAILLLGRTHRDGRNDIGRRLMAGESPTGIDILPFSGQEGMALLRGQNRPLRTAYHGLLLRFLGDGWPTGWRVLTLRTANES